MPLAGQEKFTATVEYSSDVGMSDGELATYFARAGRPERWYKVHNDAAGEEATPAAGAGDFGDDVLRLSPRAVSLYSHSDALAALPANGTRPVPHPRDTMYGMRESDTAGASRPIVNILATTVEVVKAAVEAGAAGRARAASGTAGAAGGEGRPDVAAASPRPFMRTSDGGVLPDTESIRLQTSTASRGSRVGESGTGGGSDTAAGGGGRQGDATDALLHPALSSKVLEPADSVRTVAKAQRALDDDIVHVDDAASIRPPPPAATGTTPPPPGGASGGGDGSCGGGTPAFVTDAVTAANDAAGGDATPASSISEATANAAALWPNGECQRFKFVWLTTPVSPGVRARVRRWLRTAGQVQPGVPHMQHAGPPPIRGSSCARRPEHGGGRHVPCARDGSGRRCRRRGG